ncbi:MAG: NUDIX domain-containing protein [Parcubacteria group bacterium]
MRLATLVLIQSSDHKRVLLAYKRISQRGNGFLGTPAGRIVCEDKGSTKKCAKRIVKEEWGVSVPLNSLEHVAVLNCFGKRTAVTQLCVYVTDHYEGELRETEFYENPKWYDVDNLPFSEMREDVRSWLMTALKRKKFYADIHFRESDKSFDFMEFKIFSVVRAVS